MTAAPRDDLTAAAARVHAERDREESAELAAAMRLLGDSRACLDLSDDSGRWDRPPAEAWVDRAAGVVWQWVRGLVRTVWG